MKKITLLFLTISILLTFFVSCKDGDSTNESQESTTKETQQTVDCSVTNMHKISNGKCVNCGIDETPGIFYGLDNSGHIVMSFTDYGTNRDIIIPYKYNGRPVVEISSSAFSHSSITSITIAEGILRIGQYSFYECDKLASISIPNSVTYIDKSAFYGCDMLSNITIPDSVVVIEEWAFTGCKNVTSLTVGENNPNFSAKGNCLINKAEKKIIFGNANSTIPSDGSVICIGEWAFNNITTLTDITIPEGITSIDDAAFMDCSELSNVSLPKSLTKIGDSAFHNCEKLNTIYYNGTESDWNNIEKGEHWIDSTNNYLIICSDTTIK